MSRASVPCGKPKSQDRDVASYVDDNSFGRGSAGKAQQLSSHVGIEVPLPAVLADLGGHILDHERHTLRVRHSSK